MFHHFHDKKLNKTGQGSITPFHFEKIIKFLLFNYNVLSPKEWINKSLKNSFKENDVCITFDDSLYCQYKIALKILNKYNLKAFWFIYSSVFNEELDNFEIYRKFRVCYFKKFDDFFTLFLKIYKEFEHINIKKSYFEKDIKQFKFLYPMYTKNEIIFRVIRNKILKKNEFEEIINKMIVIKNTNFKKISKNLWMTNDHLKKIHNNGHEIGLHAYNHPYALNKMKYQEQYKQLNKNYNHIKSIIKYKPVSIAYPNNSFNNNTIEIIKKLGVKIGFRSNIRTFKTNKINKNFYYPRLDHSNYKFL